MPLEAIPIETGQLRKTWTKTEKEWAARIIDEHFEAHDDWTNASTEMNLVYQEDTHLSQSVDKQDNPFAVLIVANGDFYASVGILIRGFAITLDDTIVLIGQSDDDFQYLFFPIN